MSRTEISNIGCIVSGALGRGCLEGDTILIEEGKIARMGWGREMDLGDVATVIDARGTTAMPGLVDSHVHVVFGDYTPRQRTVDFIESYLHGGITTMISAGEGVHLPGRPRDAAGVKAVAIAAQRSYANLRPSGVKVHAGSVIIEPVLTEADFRELAEAGVGLAKYGFGNFADPGDGEPQVRWAQKYGLKVMCHTGGASLPGSKPITHEHLMRLRPDVCGHANGGPTALTDEGVTQLVRQTDLVLQIVQAGNLRSALLILRLAQETGALGRIIVGSDTPTGTGMIPLAILKSLAELSSLVPLPATEAIALATGNNAQVYGLNTGVLEVGREADVLLVDAPWGSAAAEALGALELGDLPGIAAVLIDGELRVLRSRNTPAPTRQVNVERR